MIEEALRLELPDIIWNKKVNNLGKNNCILRVTIKKLITTVIFLTKTFSLIWTSHGPNRAGRNA
jgi:hypothetical protein